MASSTARAPSISCRSLCRQSSTIRPGGANKRPSGSARGAISDDRPYRDLKTPFLGLARVNECKRLLTTTIGKQQALGVNQAALEIGILAEGFLETQP